MKYETVKDLIKGELITKNECSGISFTSAFCSDLMSDVLAFTKNLEDTTLLLTGLNNIQVVRTAEMLDVKAIIFVRGKRPKEDLIEYAERCGITVLTTEMLLYDSAGILYLNGLGRKTD